VLPSKVHDVRVDKDDVLHFVTWGGGGWGDPLERDPQLVALEVRRGLVSADGARRYGVVCTADGVLDGPATEQLREQLRSGREGDLPLFDKGPDLQTLLDRAEEETGLAPPTPPRAL
jgi:N-methylhydantoinase B